jgi:hypothetical protein
MCHAHREEVADYLAEAGFTPIIDWTELVEAFGQGRRR